MKSAHTAIILIVRNGGRENPPPTVLTTSERDTSILALGQARVYRRPVALRTIEIKTARVTQTPLRTSSKPRQSQTRSLP